MTVPPPAPFGPVPSPRQLAFHRFELTGFVHFTTNTFTDLEWGYGDESPGVFNPTSLDARQWARTAKESGMGILTLTCKHHDGFCLWPSKYTEHSVKNSPWKNGRGDVVREFSDACAEFGVKFGIYLSPWDRNHAAYGQPEYITYYRNQLRELLTEYEPVRYIFLDGANGGDGYYGGARERRTIDRATYYDWAATWEMVRDLAPDAVMFSDAGPDTRWVGNERGVGAETMWCTLNTAGRYPGYSYPGYKAFEDLGPGHRDGDAWIPPEVDVSIRPGWFYHAREDRQVRTVANLLKIYYESVGRGASLLLNIPPDRRGLFHEIDVERLRGFRKALDLTFAENLARGGRLRASNVRGGDSNHDPENLLDGDAETFWATDDGVVEASVELTFDSPVRFNNFMACEHIALGQRIEAWKLEAENGGRWAPVCEGTTIGSKRLARFADVEAARVRFRVIRSRACPVLQSIGLFRAPMFLEDPVLSRDGAGMVTLSAGEGAAVRYTTDGSAPGAGSTLFTRPFALPDGGVVRATVLAEDNPGAVRIGDAAAVEQFFGFAKQNWRVVGVDSEDLRGGHGAANAIDENAASFWQTEAGEGKAGHPHALTIDLGETRAIGGFGYLPRQDNRTGGMVEHYAFETSENGSEWTAAAQGRFDNIANNPVRQAVGLAGPIRARYVRFVSHGAVNGDACAGAAEIDVYPSGINL